MAIYKVKQGKPRYTPLWIEALQTDEVFVFGSNLRGFHGGGAARVAFRKFGAEWGNSYNARWCGYYQTVCR